MVHHAHVHPGAHSRESDLHAARDHEHGVIDPRLLTTQRGIWAVKWSLIGLGATTALETAVFFLTNSVALLADTIHNFGDAATALPLWVAFTLARRKPSSRFTYGFGRVEDLAGVLVLVAIASSAVVAGYQSLLRLFEPQPVSHLWAVAAASVMGFAGNEAVAVFRVRVGREIGSAALVADGYHARADGLVSLGVLVGAVGVWLGYPLADPIAGLLITMIIVRVVWDSGRTVLPRLLDGVDPEVVGEIRRIAKVVPGVRHVADVRVRWLGHRLHAEVNLAVEAGMSVAEGHAIALRARHELLHGLAYLWSATIHVDPEGLSGEEHHSVAGHEHDGFPNHAHL